MIRFTGHLDTVVFDRTFNRVDQHISDFRNIWPHAIPVIYGIFGRAFQTEGSSTAAGKWKALSPGYAKHKAIEFPGQTILKAENVMFESMTDPEALDAVLIPDKDQLTIGSRDPKARAHQYGLGNLPARPMISFTERDKRDITKGIQSGLLQFVRGLGFQADRRAA